MDGGTRYGSERYARAWRKWWAEGLELAGMTEPDTTATEADTTEADTTDTKVIAMTRGTGGGGSHEPQRYPIGESTDLLGIDRMTLSRWLREAHMEPQTDTIDKRYKYLTRAQILELARRHNRIIRLEQAAQIGPRLSRREREMQARVEAIEEIVQQLRDQHAELLRQHTEILRILRDHLGATVSAPATAPAPEPGGSATPLTPRGGGRGGWVSTNRNPLPELPAGWVAFRAFARGVGVPETTAIRWVRRGRWPEPHRGEWASGPSGTYAITLAYDTDQQQQVRALMDRGR